MTIYELISLAEALKQETSIDSISPERVGGLFLELLQELRRTMTGTGADGRLFEIDLTGIGTVGYINLGERGLTREFIEAMAQGKEKKHAVIIRQGNNTTRCTYGGFFRPYGESGGNVYLVSLNFQSPQYIQLWQGADKIKVMTQHLVRSGDLPEVVTLEEVEEIINNLN